MMILILITFCYSYTVCATSYKRIDHADRTENDNWKSPVVRIWDAAGLSCTTTPRPYRQCRAMYYKCTNTVCMIRVASVRVDAVSEDTDYCEEQATNETPLVLVKLLTAWYLSLLQCCICCACGLCCDVLTKLMMKFFVESGQLNLNRCHWYNQKVEFEEKSKEVNYLQQVSAYGAIFCVYLVQGHTDRSIDKRPVVD